MPSQIPAHTAIPRAGSSLTLRTDLYWTRHLKQCVGVLLVRDAVHDQLCPLIYILQGLHAHGHAESVQQLRPQLALLFRRGSKVNFFNPRPPPLIGEAYKQSYDGAGRQAKRDEMTGIDLAPHPVVCPLSSVDD